MRIKNTLKYHLMLGTIIVLMGIFSNYLYIGAEQFINNFSVRRILLKITFLITFFTIYTINYRVICAKTLPQKNLLYFFGGAFSLLFIFAGIRYILDEVILFQFTGLHNYYEDKRTFGYYVFDNSSYAIQALLFSTLMYLFFSYIKNKDEEHEQEMASRTAILKQQVEELFAQVMNQNIAQDQSDSSNGKITVKVGNEATLLPVENIQYISASGSYIDMKTIDNSYVLRKSLEGILKEIGSKKFVRIHRSTVINVDYVAKLVYSNHGEIDTKMKDGTLFRVSDSYKKAYLELIKA